MLQPKARVGFHASTQPTNIIVFNNTNIFGEIDRNYARISVVNTNTQSDKYLIKID
jgi:hypothetical protein